MNGAEFHGPPQRMRDYRGFAVFKFPGNSWTYDHPEHYLRLSAWGIHCWIDERLSP